MDSHKPVQISRGTPWVHTGLYTPVHPPICSCIHLSTSHSCPPTGSTHTGSPRTSLQERPTDLSRSGPVCPRPALHTQLCKRSATPAWAPLGPDPGPRCSGLLLTQQEPGLSIQSHTSSCLDKAAGCQGPGVNEFTALRTLAPPGAGGALGANPGSPGTPAQTRHSPPGSSRSRSGESGRSQGRVRVSAAGRVACHPRRTGRQHRQEPSIILALKSGKTNNKTRPRLI